jgi:hypothetical protein
MTEISICIPRVECILKRDFVYNVIKKMKMGSIKKIIEKPLRNESNYKRIIIKMMIDPFNVQAAYVLDRFSKGENIKLVYERSRYWKLVRSH